MAETLWADYSWARPDVGKYEGVMRYLDADRGTRPDLTKAEVADLHRQGKKVGLIWQADKAGAGEGKQRGVDDAQRANREADKLGAPDTAAIFYTVDSGGLSPADVAPYFAGVRSVPGRPVGIYGSADICDWAHGEGIPWRWQTLAWSRGRISKHAHLYQRDHNVDEGSGLLDRNVKYADFPAWEPKGAKPKPKPKEDTVPDLITRAQWGARPPSGGRNALDPNPKGVAVHWNGPGCAAALATHDKCPGFLRGIQDFHMGRQRGWSDIAYSLFACPHDYLFEGRGKGIGTAANGTNYGNRYYYAIYAMWGQGDGPVPAPLLNAVRRGIDLCQTWGAGSDITVHNAFTSTTCPGPELTAWVKAGAKASAPQQTTAPQQTAAPQQTTAPTGELTVSDIDKILARLDEIEDRLDQHARFFKVEGSRNNARTAALVLNKEYGGKPVNVLIREAAAHDGEQP